MYMQDIFEKKISVVGMGYVGLTLALTFSDLGFKVIGVEKREKVLGELEKGKAHFYEAGLEDILHRELGKGFRFVRDVEDAKSDIYIISVGTPVDSGRVPDFSSLNEISQKIGKILKIKDLVIFRSTVSPGTIRNLVIPILESVSGLKAGDDFYVSFAPERTIEGRALEELRTLPQVIGGFDSESAILTANLFKIMSPQIILVKSLEIAEMVKLANNLCRDVNFAFANELALICDKFNIDTHEVINAANFGYPRDHIALPSPGVGGYCLTKDPYILSDATKRLGYSPQILEVARRINEQMPQYVVSQVEKFLKVTKKDIRSVKFCILGVAFKGKPDTSDIRFSPTIDVLNTLREKGAKNFHCYDAVVDRKVVEGLGVHFTDITKGFLDADCVLIMNNHPSFIKLDILNLLEYAASPVMFMDTWRIFSPEKILKQKGVKYSNLGFDNF